MVSLIPTRAMLGTRTPDNKHKFDSISSLCEAYDPSTPLEVSKPKQRTQQSLPESSFILGRRPSNTITSTSWLQLVDPSTPDEVLNLCPSHEINQMSNEYDFPKRQTFLVLAKPELGQPRVIQLFLLLSVLKKKNKITTFIYEKQHFVKKNKNYKE